MVNTLRITSIVAILLALGLLGFSTVFGIQKQGDEEVASLLEAPSAVEVFQNSHGQKDPTEKDQEPSLVAEAKKFVFVPKPAKPVAPTRNVSNQGPKPLPKRPPVSAKFNLLAINYFSGDPNLSSVLTKDTAGKYKWLHIGDSIGHQVVKDIQDGKLLLEGGAGQVDTMTMAEKATHTLLAGVDYPDETVGSSDPSGRIMGRGARDAVNLTPRTTPRSRSIQNNNSRRLNAVRQRQNMPSDDIDKLKDIREDLSALEKENLGATPEERERNSRRVEEIREMVRNRINSGHLERGVPDGLPEPPPDREGFDPDLGPDQ